MTTTTATLEAPVAASAVTQPFPPAGPERRFHAFVVDRVLLWSLYAAAGAHSWFLRDERWPPGLGVVASVVLLLSLASSVALGLWGVSAGKAVLGLRVLAPDGRPVGVPRALLRTAVLGLATLPTFGFGVAALAWTAVADPGGRRRGWHDRIAGTCVVDVRAPDGPEQLEVEEPRTVVNLTALRLAPTSPALPASTQPEPRPRPLPAPAVGWRVAFDTGEELVVEGLVLVGRRPEARAGEPVRTLLALPSADMSLSKTHAQFQVVPDGALVLMDRGSTNGTVLIRGVLSRRLEGGRPTTLKHGDRVRFGDHEMTVVRV